MTVVWTNNAKRELRAVHDFIAQNSARYAQGVVDRITRQSELLAEQPYLGSEVAEYGDESIRELLEHPYRIIYRVREDRVEVLSVVHGARRLPRQAPDDAPGD
jgi:plasmid stabilization system protein ParE